MNLSLLFGITEISTIVSALCVLAVTVIKLIRANTENNALAGKLNTAEQVAVAIGDAINTVTPVLGADKAKALKATISENASSRNVVSELDALVSKYKLNEEPTAALANPHRP